MWLGHCDMALTLCHITYLEIESESLSCRSSYYLYLRVMTIAKYTSNALNHNYVIIMFNFYY